MILKKIYKKITQRHWTIGILPYQEDNILNIKNSLNIKWIKTNKKSWFADPFILNETDTCFIVLVEEFPYKERKGRISKLTINKKSFKIDSIKVILELDTHLSFPAYYRENNKVYIYPENVHAGCLSLYEYDEKDETIKKIRILNTSPLADAIIAKINGEKYIIGTEFPDDNNNVLYIYSIEGILKQKVIFPYNVARNAGNIFHVGEKIIRPAQDSTKGYGSQVILQELISDRNGEIQFVDLCSISSNNRKFNLAFHTFNVFENRWIIVDAQGFRYYYLGHLFSKIKKIISNI